MRALVLAGVTLVTACSASPTSPLPSGPRSGSWVGTLSDAANGQGTVRLELQETPFGSGQGVLGGTWSTTFADPSKNAVGEASGGVTGTTVQLTLRRSVPLSCPNPGPIPVVYGSYFALNLALTGTTISGPYDYQACTSAVPGTLTLTRP